MNLSYHQFLNVNANLGSVRGFADTITIRPGGRKIKTFQVPGTVVIMTIWKNPTCRIRMAKLPCDLF